ncbi:sensor histidine kinase [Paenibacillus gansuensis]|uniref:histidine kinase n=1 Tax=Paenibacillus gansuensis TaxID=306542 RepID=A0ABW5PGE2_9BACL
MSIRLRLTLWYTLILAVMITAFSMSLYGFFSYNLYSSVKKELQAQCDEIYNRVRVLPYLMDDVRYYQLLLPNMDGFQESNLYLQASNIKGNIADKSSNLGNFELGRSEDILKKALAGEQDFTNQTIGHSSLYVYTRPIVLSNEVIGILQVGTRIDNIEKWLGTMQLSLILVGLGMILLAASLGFFLARKALKPIDHVILAANQIERGSDLGRRIKYKGPADEIGRLTDTFNNLLSRIQVMYSDLEEAYRTQRRFVSDASHELRTPLTTIRGNVDLLEKMWKQTADPVKLALPENREISLEAMRDISDEAERMSRLVNDLLALARADAGQELQKEPVDIFGVAEEVARRAQFLPHKAEWRPGDLSALEGAVVTGSKDMLQQLLFILIENAFKYTPEGHVTMDAVHKDDMIGIRVEDTGIGMAKEQVPHIFERFYRADASRGETVGTGLGLSIAKWIIEQHEGSVEVTTGLGKGTTFTVWLPVSFPPSEE